MISDMLIWTENCFIVSSICCTNINRITLSNWFTARFVWLLPSWIFFLFFVVVCFIFVGHDVSRVLFVVPVTPLFSASGDVCPGFQSQGGSLACVDSSDSPLVWHLPTSWWPAWQPVMFPTYYICGRGRMPGDLPHRMQTCYPLGHRDRLLLPFCWFELLKIHYFTCIFISSSINRTDRR